MRKIRVLVVSTHDYLGADISEILIMEGYDTRLEKTVDLASTENAAEAFQADLLIIASFEYPLEQEFLYHFVKTLPILVITARTMRYKTDIEAENCSYMTAPFHHEEFLQEVSLLLQALITELKAQEDE